MIKNPQHKYTATGQYNVNETVVSNNGCTSSVTKTFFVNGSIPVPSFSLQENTSVCSTDTIHLVDHSIVNPGHVVKIEIYWDYTNDPTIKTIEDDPLPGKTYTHTYPEFNSPINKTATVRYVAYSGQTCVQYIDKIITLLAIPAVQFNAMQGVCKDLPAFPITQASVLNGLPGSGSFSGTGVSSTGIFTPILATLGIDTIRYTYYANNG